MVQICLTLSLFPTKSFLPPEAAICLISLNSHVFSWSKKHPDRLGSPLWVVPYRASVPNSLEDPASDQGTAGHTQSAHRRAGLTLLSPEPIAPQTPGTLQARAPSPTRRSSHADLALPRCSAYQAVILSSHISGVIWYRFITCDTWGNKDQVTLRL